MGAKTDAFIAALKSMNATVKKDIAAGKPWKYYNNKRSESTFDKTRKAGKRYTNCFGGVAFGLLKAGIDAISWYGCKGGIHYNSDAGKKTFDKAFKVIDISGKKTVGQAIKDGTLKPGDILTYMSMNHTNVYLGDKKSFDAGHAYCDGSGEGATYRKWIGTTPYQGYKIAKIVRIKPVYRVRVGIFSSPNNVAKIKVAIKEKLGLDTFEEAMKDGTHVYCGSYKSKSHANERKKHLIDNGFAAMLEEN